MDAVIERLTAIDRQETWSVRILELIARRPAVLAARLAATMDLETSRFKRRVRQLKELGLTESLEVGYRLSPRGEAVLARLRDLSKNR
jgi:DNA-binding IclR family transcriptional regulator